MADTEHTFQDDMVGILRAHGCFTTPQAGSLFMAGMPDLQLNTKHGYTFSIENKVWKNKANPTREQIVGLLRPQQKVVIVNNLWPRGIYAPIFIQDMRDKEFAFLMWQDKLIKVPWRMHCGIFANARSKEEQLLSTF